MFFSRKFKSSSRSMSSPNGRLVATLFSQSVSIRAVESLEIANTVKLPATFSGNVFAFLWSPTSDKLLVATPDQIYVVPALGDSSRAVIRNPLSVTSKTMFIQFGPAGTDLLLFSPFGIKIVIFDLVASKCFEIGNPKLFGPLSARKGFSFRPGTAHLALLTRAQGKDLVSLHHPVTRELQRSWYPDTVDASQLSWSPDGRWLVLSESPAHGHKILFHTSDGHLFKTWDGPADPPAGDKDFVLGAGVRLVEWSKDGKCMAVSNHSSCICVLDMGFVTESMRLQHPHTITPSQTTQIWQEQVTVSQTGCSVHAFVKASQQVSPPPAAEDQAGKTGNSAAVNTRPTLGGNGDDFRSGAGLIAMDASTTLLASRLEDAPSTVWIWDIKAAELRAVLMFHGHVTSLSWHPSIREMLAIECEGDTYSGALFAWDPLWEGPRTVSFVDQFSDKQIVGKTRWSWLDVEAESAALFFADSKEAMFASLADSKEEVLPWKSQKETVETLFSGASRHREESPLQLIPADVAQDGYQPASDEEYDITELEDTFRFKKFTGP